MIPRTNLWWITAAWEMEKSAKAFIQSLSPEQMHKLDDMFRSTPDHPLVWEMLLGSTEELVQGRSREDIQQIEAETFGIFAGSLLKAYRKRLDMEKVCET